MTKAEFVEIAMLIKGLYPRDDKIFSDPSQIDIWYPMLCDIGYEDALVAVQKHAQSSPFPPGISDIRKHCESGTDWLIAYEEALYLIGKYGTWHREEGLAAMDDVTRETVRRIGYDRIALEKPHDPQTKREFKEIYERTQQEQQFRQRISTAGAGDSRCLTAR